MQLRILVLVSAIFFGGRDCLQARIGESKERCIERYGKPVQVLEKGLLFVKDGKKIYVTFNEGIADGIFVQKLVPGFEKRVLPLSAAEIRQCLSENGCGCVWKYASDLPDGDKIWITNGSELGALYSQATCSLQVYTRENILR